MDDIYFSNIQQDFYSTNNDFTGSREVKNAQEMVEFHNASTIRIWLNEQNIGFPPHWHSAMEIILPVEGNYTITASDMVFEVQPEEILIIPPGEMHEIYAPVGGKRFIFMFDLSLVGKLNSFSGIQSIFSSPLRRILRFMMTFINYCSECVMNISAKPNTESLQFTRCC